MSVSIPDVVDIFLKSLTEMLPLRYLLRQEVISAKPFVYRCFRRLCYLVTFYFELSTKISTLHTERWREKTREVYGTSPRDTSRLGKPLYKGGSSDDRCMWGLFAKIRYEFWKILMEYFAKVMEYFSKIVGYWLLGERWRMKDRNYKLLRVPYARGTHEDFPKIILHLSSFTIMSSDDAKIVKTKRNTKYNRIYFSLRVSRTPCRGCRRQ